MSLLSNPLNMIKENIENAGITLEMSKKELEKKYTGTALGLLWALVKPVLYISVYWFAIEIGIRGSRSEISGFPFILWLIAGIIPWFYISETLIYGGTSFRQNKHLITKIVYPVSTIPTFRMFSQLFVHIALVFILITIFWFAGYPPDIYYLQIFYYMFCMFAFMTILSWTTASLIVVSRDFEHLLKSITTMLFWLTPILWRIENVQGILKYIIQANPIYYFIKGYRDTFVNKEWFFQDLPYTIYFWVVMFVLSVLGGYIFKKLRGEFADIL